MKSNFYPFQKFNTAKIPMYSQKSKCFLESHNTAQPFRREPPSDNIMPKPAMYGIRRIRQQLIWSLLQTAQRGPGLL